MAQFYYLAYGSNCNLQQMSERCPGAKMVGKTLLKDCRLAYRRGFLTLLDAPHRNTVCAVWEIGEENMERLDRYESYPDFYGKVTVRLVVGRKEKGGLLIKDAIVYVMQDEFNKDYTMPDPVYQNACRQGYLDCEIPQGQLNEALVEITEKNKKPKIDTDKSFSGRRLANLNREPLRPDKKDFGRTEPKVGKSFKEKSK